MKVNIILILLLLLGTVIRLTALGEVPAGLTSDEVNTGYDAYSVLKTGKDQWGQTFPLTSFRGFGDYRTPLYTYLTIPFISIFGLTGVAVKLPSAIAGIISIFLLYKLAAVLFSKKIGLFAAFLFSVNPWAIGIGRQGVESSVALCFYLAGLYLYLISSKNKKFFIVSSLFFVLSIFSYTSFTIITPITILVLVIRDRKHLMKNKKILVIPLLVFLIAAIPFLLQKSAGLQRFSQVGILSDITSVGLVTTLNQQIGSCIENVPSIVCRILYNKAQLFASVFFQNFLHHFSFDLLFIKGTSTQLSLLPERGLLYLFEAVLLVVGIVISFTQKKSYKFLLILLLISAIPDSLSGGGHHSRAFVMLPFIIIFESLGAVFIFEKLRGIKIIPKTVVLSICILLVFYSLMQFFITYSTHFRIYYSSYANSSYKELIDDLQYTSNKEVYISKYLNDSPLYIYYLFFTKYDPANYHTKGSRFSVEPNGFIRVEKFRNMNFISVRFDQLTRNDLAKYPSTAVFYAHPDAFPKNIPYIKKFVDENGGAVFYKVTYNELSKHLL